MSVDWDELRAVWKEVYAWQQATFPDRTPDSIADHLLEEAVELANDPTNEIEMADVAMLLFGLVADTNTDLPAAIRKKLETNRLRKFVPYRGYWKGTE